MLTLDEQELPTADELDAEIRRRLAPLEDDPGDYHAVSAAKKKLEDIERQLPAKIAGLDDHQSLRDRVHEWRVALGVLEKQAKDRLFSQVEPEATRTKTIARALKDREEGPPLFGFEGKTEFLEWAGEQIGRSESTARNVLGVDGTGCLVKGRQGRNHTEVLQKTLENILEYAMQRR